MSGNQSKINQVGILHVAKSNDAYPYDKETLHIKLKTVKDDVEQVWIRYGDPHNYQPIKEKPDQYQWDPNSICQEKMTKAYQDESFDYWSIFIKPEFKRVRYAFIMNKGEEELLYGAHGIFDLNESPNQKNDNQVFFNFPYINEEDVYKAPEWVKDTVWYQIFPERFANGNPAINLEGTLPWASEKEVKNDMRFGGDLEGVIEHLDYIKDLGITGIYFTPIFEATSTHKYDTIDYFKIDPAFGDNATFKRLVEEAHKRGIKIMLDAVFNHCGFMHPYWQDVVKHGMASQYAPYFHILREPVINFEIKDNMPQIKFHECVGQLNYETFAFVPEMPKWRTGYPEAEEYLLSIGEYWVKEYDIDGWRLDVSNEISHDFWRKFKQRVRAIKEDVFILGENWDDSTPWLRGDQFDAVMNYEFTYPVWHLLDTSRDYNVSDFKNDMSKLLANYPENVALNMFNLIDSHDTSRIHTILGEEEKRVRLAFAIQMTFGGSPSVYYGSEIGLYGLNDGNRQCMIWDEEEQNSSLKSHVQKMIALRGQYSALRMMPIKWIDVNENQQTLQYVKETPSDEGTSIVYIVYNFSEEQQNIDIPEAYQTEVIDIYYQKGIQLNHSLTLDPLSFRVFEINLI